MPRIIADCNVLANVFAYGPTGFPIGMMDFPGSAGRTFHSCPLYKLPDRQVTLLECNVRFTSRRRYMWLSSLRQSWRYSSELSLAYPGRRSRGDDEATAAPCSAIRRFRDGGRRRRGGPGLEQGRLPCGIRIRRQHFSLSSHLQGDGNVAADGYHKYKEDVKRMKEIGLDAFRFSISWSRLIPNGRGEVNPKGLEFYNNLINELLDHGIQPHATIFHYDLPQVLEDEYNGWMSPQIIADFTAYADVCFREFGDRVTHWTTLNEPNVFALLGYDFGLGPPGRCSKPFGNCSDGNSAAEPYIVAHHCLLAHSSAVSLYRRLYQKKQQGFIGINIFISDFVPYANSTEDIAAAKRTQTFFTGWFLSPLYYGDYPVLMKTHVGSKLPKFFRDQSEQLMRSVDFLGVNYYTVTHVKDDPQDAPINKRDFMADASAITDINNSTAQVYVPSYGLQEVLEYLKQSYGNPPIFIHENGYPINQDVAFDDGLRVKFLSEHLRSLLSSLRNGSNTRGYFVWSLVDLYELLSGYRLSYGLYYVDFAAEDLKRYTRRSAVWYADFLKGRIDSMSGRSINSSLLISSA